MKVTTNSIGNYKPILQNKPLNQNLKNSKIEEKVDISKNEKTFFKNLYPDKEQEINDYHFYSKEGGKTGISLGSIFDRRG